MDNLKSMKSRDIMACLVPMVGTNCLRDELLSRLDQLDSIASSNGNLCELTKKCDSLAQENKALKAQLDEIKRDDVNRLGITETVRLGHGWDTPNNE
jgi:hypothetical protein